MKLVIGTCLGIALDDKANMKDGDWLQMSITCYANCECARKDPYRDCRCKFIEWETGNCTNPEARKMAIKKVIKQLREKLKEMENDKR